MCACLVHSVSSAARMSAQLSFGMPLRQILYATCWIVRRSICEMYSLHEYMCVFRVSVIFLDSQFGNELASLATHPRSELVSPASTIISSTICFPYMYDVIVI